MPSLARYVRSAAAGIAVVAVSLVAWIAPTVAQEARQQLSEFGAFLVNPDRPEIIYLDGEIQPESDDDFRRVRRAFPDARILVLNSPGGFVMPALTIAEDVHQEGFATIIPEGTICYSACSFIFLAGADRVAIGALGVHQISADELDAVGAQRGIADVLEILALFGTPQPVVSIMLRTAPEDMYVFSAAEVERYGINRGEIADIDQLGPPLVAEQPAEDRPPPPLTPDAEARAAILLDVEDGEWIEERAIWALETDGGRGGLVAAADFAEHGAVGLILVGPEDGAFGVGFSVDVLSDAPLFADREIVFVTGYPRDGGPALTTSIGPTNVEMREDIGFKAVGRSSSFGRDLGVLRDALTIEVWLADQRGEYIVLSFEVTDEVVALIVQAAEQWLAAEPYLGGEPSVEVPTPIRLLDQANAGTIEAVATWYYSWDALGVAVEAAGRNIAFDVSIGWDAVFVTVWPGAAFDADGVVSISLLPDVPFVEASPGVFAAVIAPGSARTMAQLIASAPSLEVRLRTAAGTEILAAIPLTNEYETLRDYFVDFWANTDLPRTQLAADSGAAVTAGAPEAVPAPAPQSGKPTAPVRPGVGLEPTYGSIALRSGFAGQPHAVDLFAGGEIDARAIDPRCVGAIADAPDYRVQYTPAARMLFMAAVSTSPIILVVRDPNGGWSCSAGTPDNPNPRLEWASPIVGSYDIWIGAAEGAGEYPAARLLISEDPTVGAPQTTFTTRLSTEAYEEIAYYQDWIVFRQDGVCGAVGHPVAAEPDTLALDEVLFALVFYPGEEGYRLLPLISFQTELNPNFYVSVTVDNGRVVDFNVDDGFHAALEARRIIEDLVLEMQGGNRMDMLAVDVSDRDLAYRFSLLGVTAALRRAQEC